MSHINSSVLKHSGTRLQTNSKVTTSKGGILSKGTGRMAGGNTRMQGRTTQMRQAGSTTRSVNPRDEDLISEDGITIRTPKPLISKEFQEEVQHKTAIIEEAKREREKHLTKPTIMQAQPSKSQIDSSNIRESSMERSSDSQKLVASSNIDKSS